MRDTNKQREWRKRKRDRLMVERYGPQAATMNMRGRHGNQPSGPACNRWNETGRMISSQGYVLIRVGRSHPLAFGNGYAYEHHLVMVAALGRALASDEVVHHVNGNRSDNRLENLSLTTRSSHAVIHTAERERDSAGRFV